VAIEIPFTALPLSHADVIYQHGPDSFARDNVPPGRTTEFVIDDSSIYPGTHRRSITADAKQRGICGGSSGGNGAFTAAWLRSDAFTRVIAFNSSFAQMPDGNPYPALLFSNRRSRFGSSYKLPITT